MSDNSAINNFIFETLSFDNSTGKITWSKRASPRVPAGNAAGTLNHHGYLRIRVMGRMFQAHRIAWLLHYGEWPSGMLDHINGCRSDNRIENLRVVTAQQNQMNRAANVNNGSGLKGASIDRRRGGYRANIRIDGRKVYLGTFATAEQAHEVYCAASIKHHGQFAMAASRVNTLPVRKTVEA